MNEQVHNEMAKAAYEGVKNVGPNNSEFRSLARSFPSKIQVNGLAAAMAFLQSKANNQANDKKNAYAHMESLINDWTAEKFHGVNGDNSKLMQRIVSLDSDAYRLYTNEVMNLCLWIKRFAEGLIAGGEE